MSYSAIIKLGDLLRYCHGNVLRVEEPDDGQQAGSQSVLYNK